MKDSRFKVFIENARILPEHEISELPEEKQKAVIGKRGIWVEVDCPEGACSVENDQITLPVGSISDKENKGVWLRLFCPDNQCSIDESTDLA